MKSDNPMTKIVRAILPALFAAFTTGSAVAEDIDIFAQNSTASLTAPNVLIVMEAEKYAARHELVFLNKN